MKIEAKLTETELTQILWTQKTYDIVKKGTWVTSIRAPELWLLFTKRFSGNARYM